MVTIGITLRETARIFNVLRLSLMYNVKKVSYSYIKYSNIQSMNYSISQMIRT